MDTKRFHNPDYKRQVRALRSYSRPVKKMPQTGLEKVLHAAGLGSTSRRIFAIAVLIFLIYLVYFAPFLKITNLEVSGADQFATQNIQKNFNAFLKEYVVGLPEKNIIFFRPGRFQNQLAADPDIAAVVSVKRKSLNRVAVKVIQRLPAFNLQAQNGMLYILNSDGTVGSQSQAANSNLPVVIDTADQAVSPGQRLLDAHKAAFLQYINANFAAETQATIEHYAIPGTAANDLILFMKNGGRVYFDSTADPKVSLQRFFTIWTGLNPGQQAKAAYIDLRFDPKAFLCYRGDPCAASQ